MNSHRVFVGKTILTAMFICMTWLGSVGMAQWTPSDREQLASQMDSAAGLLDGDRLPDPKRARDRFLLRVDRARSFMRRRTSAENYANWMDYLELEPVLEALDRKDALTDRRVSRTVGREAVALRYRLIGTHPGLELTVLRKLRVATEDLIAAVRFRDRDRSIKQIEKQLVSVAEQIRDMDDSPTAANLALLSQTVGLLQSANQAPDLVAQIQSRFRSPNMRVIVSEGAVQSLVNRGVNESQPVRDCILGTAIVGSAQVSGNVHADVLPSIGSARLQLSLSSSVNSTNIGYKKPIRIRTTGYGQVNASRVLDVDETGVRAGPVVSQASLRVDVNGIDHRFRIVRKIASRKVAEQKPQADLIARERMRQRVASKFQEQTDQATQMPPPDVMRRLRPFLGRLDLKEPTRLIGSSDTSVYAEATFARDDQLASPSFGFAPPTVTGTFDAAVQLHEIVVDNAASPVLAGRTLTESQLNTLLGRSDESPSNKDDEEEEPFEIDFARVRPIVFEARDQSLRVGVRGTRFAKGSSELKRMMEITATYRPAQMPDGSVVLIRSGGVGVEFPSNSKNSSKKRRLSISQTSVKRTIQSKFATVFPEQLLDQPLMVPPTVQAPSIAGRSFRPTAIDAQNGWLTITVGR